MKKIFILYGALAVLVIVLIIWRAGDFNLRLPFMSPASAHVNEQEMKLLVAKTEEERMIGLSKHRTLDEKTGMIFVFEEKGTHTFWMKNMQFPIDIIFIEDTTVINIEKNVQPATDNETNLPLYAPEKPINYVLEVKAGVADAYNITTGSTITFEGIH